MLPFPISPFPSSLLPFPFSLFPFPFFPSSLPHPHHRRSLATAYAPRQSISHSLLTSQGSRLSCQSRFTARPETAYARLCSFLAGTLHARPCSLRRINVPAPSDRTRTRKTGSGTRSRKAVKVDPATQRPPNAAESSPETLVPDIVRADLVSQPIPSDTDRHRWISERAYELARARGFAPGRELDDWLEAEREYETRSIQPPEDQFTG
jgi:hypothetical protein